MKQSRIMKHSRHHNRVNKVKKAKVKPVTIVNRSDVDIAIIDIVLKALYHNSHIDTLHIENDIFKHAKIDIPYAESERLWEVMLNSGLVNPVAGFGNAGKLKLSRTGYQLMAQFGGYAEYVATLKNPSAPQAIEDEIETPDEEENDCNELSDTEEGNEPEQDDTNTPK